MKNWLVIVLFLSMTFVYGQKVTGDYEKSTDFSTYKTYMFVGWQDDSDQVMNDFDRKRLRESIKSEMDARQFEFVESGGDMAVSLYVVVDEKTSTSHIPISMVEQDTAVVDAVMEDGVMGTPLQVILKMIIYKEPLCWI